MTMICIQIFDSLSIINLRSFLLFFLTTFTFLICATLATTAIAFFFFCRLNLFFVDLVTLNLALFMSSYGSSIITFEYELKLEIHFLTCDGFGLILGFNLDKSTQKLNFNVKVEGY